MGGAGDTGLRLVVTAAELPLVRTLNHSHLPLQKRGVTVKGNVDSTVIRNGAARSRYSASKKQKQQ